MCIYMYVYKYMYAVCIYVCVWGGGRLVCLFARDILAPDYDHPSPPPPPPLLGTDLRHCSLYCKHMVGQVSWSNELQRPGPDGDVNASDRLPRGFLFSSEVRSLQKKNFVWQTSLVNREVIRRWTQSNSVACWSLSFQNYVEACIYPKSIYYTKSRELCDRLWSLSVYRLSVLQLVLQLWQPA